MKRRIVPDIIEEGREFLALPTTASVREAARAMRDRSVGAVLVIEETRLAGIFTKRDLVERVVACDRDPNETALSEVLTPDPDTISPGADAMDALRLMEDGGHRHLPVIDGGRLVGIVSRRDIGGSEKARLDAEIELWGRL